MELNSHKICFIICTNNEEYTHQCIHCIQQLTIPDGFQLDVLTIQAAASMSAGYNEGMSGSDAKYKIYLHQDVFLLNQNLLFDMLRIFENPAIGMIGVVGSVHLPKTAIMWHGPRIGRLYSNNIYHTYGSDFEDAAVPYSIVEAVDGLLIMTQVDILWRSDLFTGWDFYDISQSFEMRRSGYQVVVPHMDIPWCFHDDGVMNLTHYYQTREIFKREYLPH